jgi:hypothetical protein
MTTVYKIKNWVSKNDDNALKMLIGTKFLVENKPSESKDTLKIRPHLDVFEKQLNKYTELLQILKENPKLFITVTYDKEK